MRQPQPPARVAGRAVLLLALSLPSCASVPRPTDTSPVVAPAAAARSSPTDAGPASGPGASRAAVADAQVADAQAADSSGGAQAQRRGPRARRVGLAILVIIGLTGLSLLVGG